MKLVRYGLTLKRLTEDDLELLRGWRNSDKVNRYMEYREYITPEMQKEWFNSINNPDNFYYIIIYNGEKIGMINEKGFDRSGSKTSESGLFLASEKYKNSFVPVFASLILLEISFFFLGGKDSYIRILKDNISSISYNTRLGYRLCENQEDIENQKYVLTRESFIQNTLKVRRAALKVCGGDRNMYLIWEKNDYDSGIAYESDELLKKSTLNVYDKWENGEHIYYIEIDPDNPPIVDLDPSEVNPYKFFIGNK